MARQALPFRVLLALLLVLTAPRHLIGAEEKGATPEKRPRLALNASPSFGYAPVTVQLVATLTGVDKKDPNFCHAGITWVRVDPSASPERETYLSETPRCVHEGSQVEVTTTFSKSFELDRAGTYLYRAMVEGKDGTQVRSSYVTVKVLRVN